MIKNRIWYALQIGADDNDWGCGTYDENEAMENASIIADVNPDKLVRIAVIYQGIEGNADPICIEERIIQEGE